jgi:hypothetical protein
MNYLAKNKVFQTLKEKINPPKTQTGNEVGWMDGCKDKAHFSEMAWLNQSPPTLFPRWSCAILGVHGENIFYLMSQIFNQAKYFLKEITL